MNRADFGDGDEAPQFWATFLKASSFSLYFTDFQRITPLFLSCSVIGGGGILFGKFCQIAVKML